MFGARYLNEDHLSGFDKYKVSCITLSMKVSDVRGKSSYTSYLQTLLLACVMWSSMELINQVVCLLLESYSHDK